MKRITCDALIIGAGPSGSTYARVLVSEGLKTIMVDTGPQYSKRPGENLKNSFPFQRNMGNFASMIRGFLHLISVPTSGGSSAFLDPITYKPDSGFIKNAMNPRQDPNKNLDGAAAAYSVGGMLLHWTGAVPRHHPELERIKFISNDEWEDLYTEAEKILNKHTDVYEKSIRNSVLKDVLSSYYPHLKYPYHVQNLPMGAERSSINSELVRFTGTDTILSPIIDNPEINDGRFEIRPQHRVKRLHVENGAVVYAEVDDLQNGERINIYASRFIVACGTIMSAQLLWASGIRPEALGRYLYDHPIAFCQVILSKELIEKMSSELRSSENKLSFAANDPLPIPINDPAPNIWIPVSEGRPWHCQITKDAFHYGDLPANVDDRVIVDLRWFARIETRPENRVIFEEDIFNEFGMPQPTFEYGFSEADAKLMHEMMIDMTNAAQSLGGFLPGSEPKFMPWGLCLHAQGTCRMGEKDDGKSVVDPYSKVWNIDNLYIGGNSIIPTSNACNPTLTNVALAVRGARNIVNNK
ncbi:MULTISPECIES: GMC oxidoreductase [Niastella]|uniref:Glucose 2-oxidase n=1 Tax=Niastella soli TaxID=2821487 RepID=A0ABS3Z4G2_9BACT|nr:GMC oxidoreductase [Niastella soli]MBO9204627.1 hypothetical protein [Niastella soli]